MSSMAPTLPLEIHHRIIGQATRNRDLCSLALCCKAFREEAQRELFRHLPEIKFDQQVQLFNAIIASPLRLGPMVKSCILRRIPDDRGDLVQARNAAAAALPAMRNLKTLKIYNAICLDMDSILLDCPFQLDILAFGRGDYFPKLSPALFAFLEAQPSLRHLMIYGHLTETIQADMCRNDPGLCPNLWSVGVEEHNMDLFLTKHRPIRHLSWYNFGGGSLESLQSSQLSALEYLSIKIVDDQADFSFFQGMTSLVLLDVIIQGLYNVELSQKLSFLKNTPPLQALILTGHPSKFAGKEPGEITAQAAFKLCPSLKHVDILVGQETLPVSDKFERYYSPDCSGKLGRNATQRCDVYAWKAIE